MLTFNKPGYEEVASREWLVTNGLGGYASSSLSGANTRRYHGLLVASLNPPTSRTVMVSKIEEALMMPDDAVIRLSTNQFPDVVAPEGYKYLQTFERNPIPTFQYKVDANQVTKQVFMVHDSNTTVVEYKNSGKKGIRLQLSPLFVFRDYHSLFSENDFFNFYFDWKSPRFAVIYAHYGAPPLYFSFSDGVFKGERSWYKNFEYEKEAYRGLDFREDQYKAGFLDNHLEPGKSLFLIFSLDEQVANADPAQLKADEIARLEGLKPKASTDPFYTDLAIAGNQFLVRRQSSNSYSLIAGYHWFTDWGRDTMIAMRGLCIAAGKQEEARSILETFLKSLDGGMLPNRFPDQGEAPEYNTIDATLWLFVVLYEYYQQFGDLGLIKRIFPDLTRIIESHIRGTRYNIHQTKEGLLFGGEGIIQLTWMDARVGDYVVTPRHGCPVEINALWYNALRIYHHFSVLTEQKGNCFGEQAKRVKEQFKKYFLNQHGYLNDVIIPGEYVDDAIRPNQIYALSLPFPILSDKEEKKVLDVVHTYLFTDLGLRTLNKEHPDFRGIYKGDQWQRDTAYHQGTVWPFLIGEYFLAYLKLNRYSAKAKKEVRKMMEPLRRHFYENDCIHGISEIFDGDQPGQGRGCSQQAWSVGMLLKVFSELEPSKRVVATPRLEANIS